jgi:dienelactone hydrolase
VKHVKALIFIACSLAFLCSTAQAEIKDRRTFIPVQVTLQSGEVIKRDMELVIFEDDAFKGPRPVVIYGHGYPGNNSSVSTWAWLLTHRKALNELVKLGFNVVMPLRIGQGGTGGQTLEHGCNVSSEDLSERIKNIGTQIIQTADWVKQQSFAIPDQLIFVGQSAGGSGAIGMSANPQNPFRLIVNFAGGSGKDRSPDFPCSPEAYADRLAVYGKESKMEMLWIYGLNDTYWGKNWPVKWVDAYKTGGGKVEFHQVDSQTLEGHNLFRQSPEVWVPIVKRYLVKQNMLPATN